MASDPLDDLLERTFAESYRRQIDAEENVWRSLPFFGAALAVLLAAIAAVASKLGREAGPVSWVIGALLTAVGLATLAALVSMAKTVAAADFRIVTPEVTFLRYAELLRARALQEAATDMQAAETAAILAKRSLLREYAAAAEQNRRLNLARESWRTWAALALIVAVLLVLVVVGLVLVT